MRSSDQVCINGECLAGNFRLCKMIPDKQKHQQVKAMLCISVALVENTLQNLNHHENQRPSLSLCFIVLQIFDLNDFEI